jgi:hypothetical protein
VRHQFFEAFLFPERYLDHIRDFEIDHAVDDSPQAYQ